MASYQVAITRPQYRGQDAEPAFHEIASQDGGKLRNYHAVNIPPCATAIRGVWTLDGRGVLSLATWPATTGRPEVPGLSADLNPAFLVVAAQVPFDYSHDLMSVGERWKLGRCRTLNDVCVHVRKEVLDTVEIALAVPAGIMSVRRRGCGEQGGILEKNLVGPVSSTDIENLRFLLEPPDRAPPAIHLEEEAVLMPGADLRDREGSANAFAKPHKHRGVILGPYPNLGGGSLYRVEGLPCGRRPKPGRVNRGYLRSRDAIDVRS